MIAIALITSIISSFALSRLFHQRNLAYFYFFIDYGVEKEMLFIPLFSVERLRS